ncbi:hypothetical protein WL67_01195 [Burkholderia ubonensis]|nr:hypothetical protein WL67_01195 [Burkholderia ubonensis]KWD56128.1 hypothetical protein WL66_10755 [Burkholderia ubonensis]
MPLHRPTRQLFAQRWRERAGLTSATNADNVDAVRGTPFYSKSARQHAEALVTKKEHDHADHSVQHHYREDEVFKAVNEKQKRLNERYGPKPA